MAKNPSACENAVTAPEPFAVGNATRPSSAPTRETSANSSRPSSDGMRNGTRAVTVCAASTGNPARARMSGATKAWNVKIAEVGNPGSTISGVFPITARQSGLPGLSATPCTRMPGLPSRDTTWCDKSPAPFDVPPLSTTMSHEASAARMVCSSADWSSAIAPSGTASPPASVTAATIMAPLLS